jgi:hypothetical protein
MVRADARRSSVFDQHRQEYTFYLMAMRPIAHPKIAN